MSGSPRERNVVDECDSLQTHTKRGSSSGLFCRCVWEYCVVISRHTTFHRLAHVCCIVVVGSEGYGMFFSALSPYYLLEVNMVN